MASARRVANDTSEKGLFGADHDTRYTSSMVPTQYYGCVSVGIGPRLVSSLGRAVMRGVSGRELRVLPPEKVQWSAPCPIFAVICWMSAAASSSRRTHGRGSGGRDPTRLRRSPNKQPLLVVTGRLRIRSLVGHDPLVPSAVASCRQVSRLVVPNPTRRYEADRR